MIPSAVPCINSFALVLTGSRIGRSVVINSAIAGVLFFCSTPIAFFNKLHGLIQLTLGAGGN